MALLRMHIFVNVPACGLLRSCATLVNEAAGIRLVPRQCLGVLGVALAVTIFVSVHMGYYSDYILVFSI
jgi:hypothetical protein